MDQATLVGPDISVASQALQVLDDSGIKPAVAMLIVFPEYDDWRLLLSSPLLDQNHLLRAYEQVTAALQGRFVGSLVPIFLLPMKDPFIRELRGLFSKTKDVAGMRLGGQRIGNRFVSNAYVFRIR